MSRGPSTTSWRNEAAGGGLQSREKSCSKQANPWKPEQLRVHHSLRCHRDNHYELLHSFYWLSCYSRGSTLSGNGLGPLCVTENPELLAGPWAIPEETTDPAENQEEDFLRDPNLHLNIEESDKEFMAVREELYDSLMNRRWHCLDTVLSNVPDELPQCEVF